MMKVAIVHELLHKLGGAERVVKVFADMFPDAPIYTLLYDEKKVGSVFPKERIITSRLQKYFKIIKRPQPLLTKMPQAIEMFDFSGYDLVISSSSAFAHGILTPLETKHICYCHSPMRYAWDYTNEYRKEKSQGFLGNLKSFMISKALNRIRQWDKIASDRPDKYLANAKTVQKRLSKYYQLESKVLYPPVDVERFKVTKEKKDYFLIVSALTFYKKIDLAIKAFNQTKEPLFIIGSGNDEVRLKSMANENIKFLGRKSDEEVTKYMEEAKAFLFPGEDDFGITPVEAMAAGTPVLAYKKGGVLETVVEGQTGEFFEEQSITSLLHGVKKIKSNYSSYNIDDLRSRADEFSEKSFKEQLQNEINQLIRARSQ